MKYCYIVAEGIHDIEFLTKIIKELFNLSRIKKRSLVNPFWDELIPKTFPMNDDLLKRMPVPSFIQNEQCSIALHNATGINNIVNTLEESLSVIETSKLFSIGLILDADTKDKPQKRFKDLIQELSKKIKMINFTSLQLGEVNMSNPRFGVFILPDNQNQGTLESILMECAKINYPDLLESATEYIEGFDQTKLTVKELKEFKKLAGKNKAIISSISSILKPGKAIQVSLQDNKWIDEKTIELDDIILLKKFITDLIF